MSTPRERSLQARLAAYTRWSREDPVAGTGPARSAFLGRFEAGVDPKRRLPEPERRRRAQAALRAYMTGLALKSAKARRARKQGAGR